MCTSELGPSGDRKCVTPRNEAHNVLSGSEVGSPIAPSQIELYAERYLSFQLYV